MIDDGDFALAAIFAVVTGTFVGAVIADPKLARQCAREEVKEQGFAR